MIKSICKNLKNQQNIKNIQKRNEKGDIKLIVKQINPNEILYIKSKNEKYKYIQLKADFLNPRQTAVKNLRKGKPLQSPSSKSKSFNRFEYHLGYIIKDDLKRELSLRSAPNRVRNNSVKVTSIMTSTQIRSIVNNWKNFLERQ